MFPGPVLPKHDGNRRVYRKPEENSFSTPHTDQVNGEKNKSKKHILTLQSLTGHKQKQTNKKSTTISWYVYKTKKPQIEK